MSSLLLDRPSPPSVPPRLWRPGDGDNNVVIAPKPASLFHRPAEIDHIPNAWERDQWNKRERERFAKTGQMRLAGGAAGTWTFTNELRTKILQGAFAIGTDTFKMALLLSTTNIGAASTTYAGVTNEVATNFGYTQGGVTVTLSLSGTTSVPIAFTQAQWTASGGSITARYVLLYKSGGNVYAYALCDNTPADVTATSGNTFTVTAGNVATLA